MKAYLGDAVYADFDGFGLVLTTEDGISETNRIVLEPEVLRSLVEYVDARLKDLSMFSGVLDPTPGRRGIFGRGRREDL